MSGVVAFEGELNTIIKEYLEFSQFSKTVNAFERECTERGKHISSTEGKSKVNQKSLSVQTELLQLFEYGRRKDFFRLWTEYIPTNLRNEDAVAQKLEFYLHIYFAIYPIKYGEEDTEGAMVAFKSYLETRGAALSQTTEFLPFYALPFVPNPSSHPSYKELFSDQWVPDFRSRLEKFLTLALQSTKQPLLFDLYQGAGGRDNSQTEHRLAEGERKLQAYLKRYNRVQADYHNLISITADLVDSLEATVQGHPVSPEYLQQVCVRLFSNQMRQSHDFSRPGTAGEILRQSAVPPQGLQHSDTVPGGKLDFDKIKSEILHAPERQQALLLQALRWKLTKSTPTDRDVTLANYIGNDLLGCGKAGNYRDSVLHLLQSDNVVTRQYLARLFNAFASLADGRSYLAHNPNLMKAVMLNLRSEESDVLMRENVLGCLQKLSLRRQLQSLMIDEGIIGWLVSILEDDDNLSDYTLEYSVALMMNLCLRSSGKKKCAEDATQVLRVLSNLLGHENQEIIPYVNGTLYSILAIPYIREQAKAMGMEDILRCFLKEGQPDMNRQIEFIIKQLNSVEEPDEVESDDEDDEEDEEDQDSMETDLDKSEMVKPQTGELSGDRLLNTHYVSTGATNKRRKPTDLAAGQDELLMRPITPSQRKTGSETPVIHNVYSRPHTGQSHRQSHSRVTSSQSHRAKSRDMMRPPTRSGSRPSSSQSTPHTPQPAVVDREGSEMISKLTGKQKVLAATTDNKDVRPSQKALNKNQDGNDSVHEYGAAFGSRPRISRTPDPNAGTRPTSKGSVGDGPTPQPKYSDSLPTPRPGSGGRPSSASGKKTSPPSASRAASRKKPR